MLSRGEDTDGETSDVEVDYPSGESFISQHDNPAGTFGTMYKNSADLVRTDSSRHDNCRKLGKYSRVHSRAETTLIISRCTGWE